MSTKKTSTNLIDIELLKKLFIHRSDIYAKQKANGGYSAIASPITDELLTQHLQGKTTIGTYQLDEHNTVKLSCIDIDINKKIWNSKDYKFEDWKDIIYKQINEIKNKLSKHGITGYGEISGFKGAHVWYFFNDPVPAGIVRDLNHVLFSELHPIDPEINLELFPKQSAIGEKGYGNQVKLPLGIHNKSKKFSYFVDDITQGINLLDEAMIQKIISSPANES